MQKKYFEFVLAGASIISLLGFVLAALRESRIWASIDRTALHLYTPGDYASAAIDLLPMASITAAVTFAIWFFFQITKPLDRTENAPNLPSQANLHSPDQVINNASALEAIANFGTRVRNAVDRIWRVAIGRVGYFIPLIGRQLFLATLALVLANILVNFVFWRLSFGSVSLWPHELMNLAVLELLFLALWIFLAAALNAMLLIGIPVVRSVWRAGTIILGLGFLFSLIFALANTGRNYGQKILFSAYQTERQCYEEANGILLLSSACTLRVLERATIYFDSHDRNLYAKAHDGSFKLSLQSKDFAKFCQYDFGPTLTGLKMLNALVPVAGEFANQQLVKAKKARVCVTASKERDLPGMAHHEEISSTSSGFEDSERPSN